MSLSAILWTIVIFFISAIPLHLAVKMLKGKTNILKTALIVFIGGIIVAVVKDAFDVFGGLFAFLLLLFIYRIAFKLGWIRALLVWLLQFVVIFLLSLLILAFFGVAIIGATLI